jgi:predicted AAA+ superfamily ATPase
MSEEPVVILTGPRTVGESTLLAALAAEFDRPALLKGLAALLVI